MNMENMLIGFVLVCMVLIGGSYMAVTNVNVSGRTDAVYTGKASEFQHAMLRINTTMTGIATKIDNFQTELNNVNLPQLLFQAFPSLLTIGIDLFGLLTEIPNLIITYIDSSIGLPWWFTSGVTFIVLIYVGMKIYYIVLGRTPV